MSAEKEHLALTVRQNKWLTREFRKITSGFPLDQGCRSVEAQMVNDLAQDSKGAEIPFSEVEYLRVDMIDRSVCYRMVEDTPLGHLAIEVGHTRFFAGEDEEPLEYPHDVDNPEFALICGSLFGGTRLKIVEEIQTETGEYWPSTSDKVVHSNFFSHGPNVLFNRRAATLGRLVTRPTFTEEEYARYAALKPLMYNEDNDVPYTIEFSERSFERILSIPVSIGETILGLAVVTKKAADVKIFT